MNGIYKIPGVNDQQSVDTNINPTSDTANNSIVNGGAPTNSSTSNINNVIDGQSYTNTSSTNENAGAPTNGAPVVSSETTSTTPGEASSGGQPDATATALAGQKAVVTSQQNDLTSNKNADIVAQSADNIKYLNDLQKTKDDQIKAQEDADKKIEALKVAEEARAKSIVDEQNRKLLEEEKASIADLEASKAQQKLIDEQAIKNQEINNNVLQQKSAWAFNKLGLSFSGGALEQGVQIAQNGAYAIAILQSNVVKNQTALTKDIVNLKNSYSTKINDNINKYNDLVAKYKEDSITRINNLTLNKLKTSEEILKEKKATADAFRKTVSDLEKQFKEDQKSLAEDAVKNAEQIRLNSERIKNEKLTNLSNQLISGDLSKMTPDEIVALEDELQVPKGYIKAKMNEGISTTIRGELDKIAGSDYYPNNMNDLVSQVNAEMKQGRDMTTAINNVISREKQSNPNIQKAVENKKAKENLDAEKLRLERDKFEFDKGVTSSEFKETYGTDLSVSPGTGNTRADRNNNPGNLRVEGTNGRDSGGFGIFNTPEEGFNAMVKDVSAKVNGGSRYSGQIKTLYDLISVYAPAGDNNNPSSYANIVAKALGINANAPISSLKGREVELAKAMAKHEGWTGSVTNADKKENIDIATSKIEDVENSLSNMTSAELRAFAGKEGIQFDDSKNVNTLRANIVGAIKGYQSSIPSAQRKAGKESFEDVKVQSEQYKANAIASKTFIDEIASDPQTEEGKIVSELNNINPDQIRIENKIGRTVNPFEWGKTSPNSKKMVSFIKSLESQMTLGNATPEQKKTIRETYIYPLLEKKGFGEAVLYDKKSGAFSLKGAVLGNEIEELNID